MQPGNSRLFRFARPFIVLALLLLAAAGLRPAAPALAACDGNTEVGTEAELNAALALYEAQANPCVFTIKFTDDIELSADLMNIQNANPNLYLIIDGGGFTLDGRGIAGTLNFNTSNNITIHNLTVANSKYSGITSRKSTLNILHTTLRNNSADGVFFVEGNLTVVNSTSVDNRQDGLDVYYEGVGSTVKVINSTFVGNFETGVLMWRATARLAHVTMFGNGTGLSIGDGNVTVNNSIMAGNSSNDCAVFLGDGTHDINFSLVQKFDDDTSCDLPAADGNLTNIDPMLLPLGDYGGITPTMPPKYIIGDVQVKSPVIDKGGNDLSRDEENAILLWDQRGTAFPREINNVVDMGAVEAFIPQVCSFNMNANSEESLTYAIYCFNHADDGDFTITFQNDITLTADLLTVDNDDPDVSLTIDGAGHELDGDGENGTFEIRNTAAVTIDHIDIINSGFNGIYSVDSNLSLFRATVNNSEYDAIHSWGGDLKVIRSSLLNSLRGIASRNSVKKNSNVIVINSTFAGHEDAAVHVSGGTAQLTHVSVYGNFRGLWGSDAVQMTVHNSVLAGSEQWDCHIDYGATITAGNTLVQKVGTCNLTAAGGNILNQDPLLGAPGYYGGETPTMPLLRLTGDQSLASPAIDNGDEDLSKDESGSLLSVDQRSSARKTGDEVDMGAYEGVMEFACGASMTVGDALELDAALLCFNLAAGGDFTILFEDDIETLVDLREIANSNTGVSLTIDGAGYMVDGRDQSALLSILNTDDVTIERLTITRSVEHGINVQDSGLRLHQATVTANNWNGINNQRGELTVVDSTIMGSRDYGISSFAQNPATASTTLINSTIADNNNIGLNFYSTVAVLRHVTVSGNRRGVYSYDGTTTINNSILANSSDGDDCHGINNSPVSISHSLVENPNSNCGLTNDDDGNIVGQDPLLGDLGNNGGPTQTHLPGEGSPAIDAGDDALAVDEDGDDLTADQRGFTRFQGSAVDMGAVEVQSEQEVDSAVYMSATKSGNAGGVAYDNSDILMWDGEAWSKVFDGSAAGLFPENKPKHNTNAFWLSGEGGEEVIMSFGQNGRKVPGITTKVDGMDLVRWDGETFSLYFDGSDVGLTQKTPEKIDGLHVLPGSAAPDDFDGGCVAWLLISTQGPAKVPVEGGGQLKAGGEDVLGFCATNLGEDTAGFWHMVLDASTEGMPRNATDSISLSADGQTLYLTTRKPIKINEDNVFGGHSMIYAFNFTTGEFSGPHFSAPANGLNRQVDGLQVEGELP